jgi:polyisoprenoid-binding protein YceI
VNVDADSVFTNEETRDKHLKSADFFEVDKFRELTFKGTSIKKVSDNNYLLKGLLTIKGISKEVSLDVEYGGIMKDPWGKEKAGFSISGRINRKDWGLNWNAVIESGGVFVADEVQISGEIQLVRQE